VRLGERAFEIVLARAVAAGEADTEWFRRHGSTPITEVPDHWPEAYRAVVERRIACIEANPEIALIEQPQYKRRWATVSWDDAEHEALRAWLLDRMEAPGLWDVCELRTTAQLAARLRTDTAFVAVAELYAGVGCDLTRVVTDLAVGQAVPHLAADRYSDAGLRKRAEWERVWDLQRREDAGEAVGTIPVPPRYASTDFRRTEFWQQRGKLDVPKERFVTYPGLGRPGETSPLIGWAGWDHLQRAMALVAWLQTLDPGDTDRAARCLAGLAELLPWVRQWHDTPAEGHAGTELAQVLDAECARRGLSAADLAAVGPAATKGAGATRAPRSPRTPRTPRTGSPT
jgi:hypothetical protein